MILVYIENDNGAIKKSSLEALAYASALSNQNSDEVLGVASGVSDSGLAEAGRFGVSNVLSLQGDGLAEGNTQAIATALNQLSIDKGADIVIMSHSSLSEGIASRLAIKLSGTAVTNVIGLPDANFNVKRGIFTGKAFQTIAVTTTKKVLTIKKNSFEVVTGEGSASVESLTISVGSEDLKVKVLETKKQEGDILLPEAELVVSAGRGLKGPENWGMIEELAKTLGAATACSKPVSDVDWRPHHEHVGQTGLKISPNLYIAVGISGAIQHLAGVSSSKVIVVVNTDPEAPFFKAADYGIVADAFDVVPKLVEALKSAG